MNTIVLAQSQVKSIQISIFASNTRCAEFQLDSKKTILVAYPFSVTGQKRCHKNRESFSSSLLII